MKSTNWKEYIAMLLTKNNAFQLVKSEQLGQTEKDIYTNNSKTTYEVGYIDEHLIYLNLTNPRIPGYNEHTRGEYFCNNYFDIARQAKVALEFDETNRKGIQEILESGLSGYAEQFLLNNKVVYSKLFLDDMNYQTNIDLSNRTIWQKIFGPKIENIKGIQKQTIQLNEVFSGNR